MTARRNGPLAEVLDFVRVGPLDANNSAVTLEPLVALFVGQNPSLLAADGKGGAITEKVVKSTFAVMVEECFKGFFGFGDVVLFHGFTLVLVLFSVAYYYNITN